MNERESYRIGEGTGGLVTVAAWVEAPQITMCPAGSSSHPYPVLVLEGRGLDVHVDWRE